VDRFWFLWLEAESFCELDGFTLFLKIDMVLPSLLDCPVAVLNE